LKIQHKEKENDSLLYNYYIHLENTELYPSKNVSYMIKRNYKLNSKSNLHIIIFFNKHTFQLPI